MIKNIAIGIGVLVTIIFLFVLLPVKGGNAKISAEALTLGLVCIAIGSGVAAGYVSNSLLESTSDKVKDVQKTISVKQGVDSSIQEYNTAKITFASYSDSDLDRLYQMYLQNNKEDMTKLALEEELLSRGLIRNSPMKDKIESISRQ